MYSRCLEQRALRRVLAHTCVAAIVAAVACSALAAAPELRVCSDPDNMPYSDQQGRGFENAIARVLADELQRPLVHVWQPLTRGFVRKTLGEKLCDVLIGVPADFERVLTTRPYYRSAYVFVARRDGGKIAGFDDPRLRHEKVGVQLIGNDLAATPAGYALARHGAIDNVIGYTIYGDGPAAARMTHAIERGELGIGVWWGPQAGYFAARTTPPLSVTPAMPPADLGSIPFEFAISVGVRKSDRALRDALDAALERRRADIDSILAEYSVPRTDR